MADEERYNPLMNCPLVSGKVGDTGLHLGYRTWLVFFLAIVVAIMGNFVAMELVRNNIRHEMVEMLKEYPPPWLIHMTQSAKSLSEANERRIDSLEKRE